MVVEIKMSDGVAKRDEVGRAVRILMVVDDTAKEMK